MQVDTWIVVLGAVLSTVGALGYVRDTLRGSSKPNRATFFLWALAPLIAVAAEIGERVGIVTLTTLVAGLAPTLVLAASFVNPAAYWRLTRFDYLCAGLSLAALVLWLISGSGNVAIVFAILADLLAAVPTIVKAYRYPETETGMTYLLAGLNGICGVVVALGHPSFATLGFPIYLVLICALLSTLILVPRNRTAGPLPAG